MTFLLILPFPFFQGQLWLEVKVVGQLEDLLEPRRRTEPPGWRVQGQMLELEVTTPEIKLDLISKYKLVLIHSEYLPFQKLSNGLGKLYLLILIKCYNRFFLFTNYRLSFFIYSYGNFFALKQKEFENLSIQLNKHVNFQRP